VSKGASKSPILSFGLLCIKHKQREQRSFDQLVLSGPCPGPDVMAWGVKRKTLIPFAV
jgi:hypothetical protein